MSTDERSDADLVHATAGGDRQAFAQLYDRYAPRLLGLAERILGRRSDAEDLLHDFFIEVGKQAHGYDKDRGSVASWLVLRLRSRALDRLRSPAYRRFVDLESAPKSAEPSISADVVAAESERDSLHRSLQASLQTLPDETRAILELVYFRDRSLPEVASELKLPLGTVKSRIHRALRALRATAEE